MLYPLIRKFFFALDAETAHGIGMRGTEFLDATGLACLLARPVTPCPVEAMGLTFPNPVGLAAGLDKNGDHIDALARLGFGFIEIGTITPRPQPGNPRPRLFRIPEAQGIVNRMGFNNDGVDKLLENVHDADFPTRGGILGINIGKNATTPIEKAADDYLECLSKVYPVASYVTVNISSPNTKNLRELQKDDALDDLLAQLKARQEVLAQRHGRYVPMALKIAPDLDDAQIVAIADALRRHRMDGVIATNTTLSREGVEGLANADEAGGLSGAPVFRKSTEVLRKLSVALAGELPIIGVGGIMGGEDAAEKIYAGASLVQFYSGFIYRGPDLVSEVADTLARVLRKKA
jgi:dihydroorotate dehydrogenase